MREKNGEYEDVCEEDFGNKVVDENTVNNRIVELKTPLCQGFEGQVENWKLRIIKVIGEIGWDEEDKQKKQYFLKFCHL